MGIQVINVKSYSVALMVGDVEQYPFQPKTERDIRQLEIHFRVAKPGPVKIGVHTRRSTRQVSETSLLLGDEG